MTSTNCNLISANSDQQSESRVFIPRNLVANLIGSAIKTLPKKTYGLIGGLDLYHPTSMYQCRSNLRNSDSYWKERIDSFGDFYKNPERGFIIDPKEVLNVYKKMEEKKEHIVGVFHSHRCFVPGEPTEIDMALHLQCQPHVLAYLLGVMDPAKPTLRVFKVLSEDQYRELNFSLLESPNKVLDFSCNKMGN